MRTRWWLVLASSALVVATPFAIRYRSAKLRQAAIDRIVIENEALTPAYFARAPATELLDASAWLTRAARWKPAWDMSALSDPARYAVLLDEARQELRGDAAREAFAALEACLAGLESPADAAAGTRQAAPWAELAVRLRDCDATEAWGPCTEQGLGLLALGLKDGLALAQTAHQYAPIDALAVAARLESEHASMPRLPFLEEARIGDAVHVSAVHAAQIGRAEEALDALRAGLHVARLHSSPRWLLSSMMWSLHVLRVLDGLQTVLPMLPRDLDVADLEKALTDVRPREIMAQAIRGERAFGNRLFEMLREGTAIAGDHKHLFEALGHGPRRWLCGDADQARYLDTLTDLARTAEKSRYLREPVENEVAYSSWLPLSSIVMPALGPSLDTSDRLEARLVLARAALRAYRTGAQETLKLLGESTDPFDGRPIRCALGDRGLIVFWSVGPDGRDDGADPRSDDIAWRLVLADATGSAPR